MKKNSAKKFMFIPLSALAVGALLNVASGNGSQVKGNCESKYGKYFPAFTTLTEAQEAAADLNADLSAEGNVLLKNLNNTLPLSVGSYVSIFGTNAYAPVGGGVGSASIRSQSLTLAQAMSDVGFHVNNALVRHYEDQGVSATSGPMSSGGAISDQYNDFDGSVTSSFDVYDDAAIIVLGRNAGEGGDVSRATGEEATEDDIKNHRKLADYTKSSTPSSGDTGGFPFSDGANEESKSYKSKHALMLTEDERSLIKTVENKFKKVIVLLNTSNVMEIGELKDDDHIQGIMWIGRPGEDGLYGTAKILNGEVNPSGHLVDEWPRDLTADPTWENFGDNSQAGSSTYYYKADGSIMCNRPQYDSEGNIVQGAISDDWTDIGVDYEEDIYLGYRYYETYYEDKYKSDATAAKNWYDKYVAYSFGDGLSYTTFSMNINDVYKDKSKATKLEHQLTASEISSDTSAAKVKKLYVEVEVENTGLVAGKETVQVYVSAPYTSGKIEKSCEDLVGYAKTSTLQPGEKEIVTVEFNIQDFASWDYNDANGDGVKGDYELDAGNYTIRVMETAHRDMSVDADDEDDALDEYSFTLDAIAHQHLDDFSDNRLENLFTTENGKYTDKYVDSNANMHNSLRTADMMKDGKDAEVLMSRADFDNTFPEAPKTITDSTGAATTTYGLQFTDEVYNIWQNSDISRLTYHPSKAIDTSTDGIRVNTELVEDDTQPWYISESEAQTKMSGWTQASDANNRTITLKFKDLNGLDYDDPKYDEFLNQLTWDEITSLSTESRASTPALDAFGKEKSVDEDGPNDFANTPEWCCEVTIASTWNKELAYKEGLINGSISTLMGRTGWYGPGMDMHRSAFSGRNNEYYSQDGIQGGYIAAEVVKGARSVGCNPMVKHLAFNDQETNRGGQSLYTWQSEQNIRQYEIKEFQMAIQEGGANSGMSAYGRICGVVNQSNWYLMTGLLQNQFGWHGFMITDGFLGMRWCTTIDLMVRAGNGIVYKTEPWYDTLSGTWDATKRNGKGDVVYVKDETASNPAQIESWNQYYYARRVAHSVLWATANSANYQNGFTETKFEGKDFTGTASTSVNFACGYDDSTLATLLGADSSVRYTLNGSLPSGLSFNELTGTISGTSNEIGQFSFSVTATFDNYVSKTANFTITLNSPFSMSEGSDDPSNLKVGDDVAIQYTSSVFTTEGGTYDTVTYSSSDLPEGLTISEAGLISGKPTKAGTYTASIKVVAKKEAAAADPSNPFAGMFGGGGATTKEITFSVTFTIAGDTAIEKTIEEQIAELESELASLKSQLGTGNDSTISERIAALEAEIASLKGEKSSGCGGSIIAATSSVGAIALLGVALALKKKKEDK